MGHLTKALTFASVLAILPAAAGAADASATVKDRDGKTLGVVTFHETASGMMHIVVDLTNVPPGVHGLHVHAVGDCSAADFTSAGGHLASDLPHGVLTEGGPHPGDLPNAHVSDDGVLKVEHFNTLLTLKAEGVGAMMDADGSAVMLHSGADDYTSQPAGAAGSRIACGVVEKAG